MMYICAKLSIRGKSGYRILTTDDFNGIAFKTKDVPESVANSLIAEGKIVHTGGMGVGSLLPYVVDGRVWQNPGVLTAVELEDTRVLCGFTGEVVQDSKSEIWNATRIKWLSNQQAIEDTCLFGGEEYKDFVIAQREKANTFNPQRVQKMQSKLVLASKDVEITADGVFKRTSTKDYLESIKIPEGAVEAVIENVKNITSASKTLKKITIGGSAESVDLEECENLTDIVIKHRLICSRLRLPKSIINITGAGIYGKSSSFEDSENLQMPLGGLFAGEWESIRLVNNKNMRNLSPILCNDTYDSTSVGTLQLGGSIETVYKLGSFTSLETLILDKPVKVLSGLRVHGNRDLTILGDASIRKFSRADVVMGRTRTKLVVDLSKMSKLKTIERHAFEADSLDLIMPDSVVQCGLQAVNEVNILRLSPNLDSESATEWLRSIYRLHVDELRCDWRVLRRFVAEMDLDDSIYGYSYEQLRDYIETEELFRNTKLVIEH